MGETNFCKPARAFGWSVASDYIRAAARSIWEPRSRLTRASFRRVERAPSAPLPELRHARITGTTLAYRRYDAPAAGRSLILVHGSGCFADQFARMAQDLAARRSTTVYTIDMRGHGASAGPSGHAVERADQLSGDILAFAREVRRERPHDVILLGGHSAGGGLVVETVKGAPAGLISGCILLAPFLGVGAPIDRAGFGGWVRVRPWRLGAAMLARALGSTRLDQLTVVDFDRVGRGGDGRYCDAWSFATMLAFGARPWSGTAAPLDSALPVLVLTGARDECFISDRYAEALAGVAPHATLRTASAGGHWDLLVDPNTADLIAAWADRRFEHAGEDRTERGLDAA